MRRAFTLLLSLVVTMATVLLIGAPAQAARPKVKVVPVSTLAVGWDGHAVLTPTVKRSTGVKVRKVRMTVRQSGRVVRKNARSASLTVGTYAVRVKVTYRKSGVTRSLVKRFRTTVTQKACATAADYASLVADGGFSATVGDSTATVAAKLHSTGVGKDYSPAEAIEILQAWKVVMKDLAPAAEYPTVAADIDSQIAVVEQLEANGLTSIGTRTHPACGGGNGIYTVLANGELFHADRDDHHVFGMS